MEMELVRMLFGVATFIGVIPSIIAVAYYKGLDEIQKMLALLVWGGTLIGALAYLLGTGLKIENLFLLHFYTVFDFLMLTLIFSDYLGSSIVKISIVVFSILALSNSIINEQLNSYNILARSVEAFVIICYVLRYFWVTLRDMKTRFLEQQPIFWISCGALLYYAAGFFIFIFSNDLLPHDNLWWTYWGVHAIFTILLYVFYSIALWVQPKQQPISPGSYFLE